MSLWLIETISPIFSYNLWDGIIHPLPGQHYNDWLITPPRIFDENINSIKHFFYEAGGDRLVAFMLFNIYHWPGWACWRYEWNAGDGSFIRRVAAGITAYAWANHAGAGSYNHIYTTYNANTKIHEVPYNTLWPDDAHMWWINPYTWNPKTVFNHAVVNREDNLIAGVGTWDLEVWDISGTPVRIGKMRLPNILGYMSYENQKLLWIITKDGLIAKANYQIPRWEMLSSVQNPAPDAINYFCAFDSKRKRLAVLRQRPDAVNGQCQCQFEFYRPLIKVEENGLTDPVPVTRILAGDSARFVAHIHGTQGEGITPYPVDAALQVPVQGEVLSPVATSELNGVVTFRYKGPDFGGVQDTLILTTTISQEGE
jgi:hypothetical protein